MEVEKEKERIEVEEEKEEEEGKGVENSNELDILIDLLSPQGSEPLTNFEENDFLATPCSLLSPESNSGVADSGDIATIAEVGNTAAADSLAKNVTPSVVDGAVNKLDESGVVGQGEQTTICVRLEDWM